MNITFAQPSALLSYREAIMYCLFCNYHGCNDWRMPTHEEYIYFVSGFGWGYGSWFLDCDSINSGHRAMVIPVRDT